MRETPAAAFVDGKAGLGAVVGQFSMQLAIEKAIYKTRSLGALRAPTSSLWPFGPALALRAGLTSSFAPFGRSGRVTYATVQ